MEQGLPSTIAMDNSFLIVESFDETVYPEKNAESQEIDDYENSLEALKAHMDRVLKAVGVGKGSRGRSRQLLEEASAEPTPAPLDVTQTSPLPVEAVTSPTPLNGIQTSPLSVEMLANDASNMTPDFTPVMVSGMPEDPSVVPVLGIPEDSSVLPVPGMSKALDVLPVPGMNTVLDMTPVLGMDAAAVPTVATTVSGEIVPDLSQFEPEIVPGQVENAQQREKGRVKGRRTGRINYNEGGETQDFFPLPRSQPLPEAYIYEPPTAYGIPLPTTTKLLNTITFGSLVSEQHAAEQRPVERSSHQTVKKSRGRPRTIPCPPMEALQQELALGNVEFSITGGTLTMLASNQSHPLEKQKRKRKSCVHGRDKGKCRECGGISFCIHQRYKYTCIDCGGPGVCEHKRRRAECKDCKGGSVCIHNRIRRRCGDCGGKAKCEHKRLKWQCKDCHGSSICHHNKRKHSCKLCRNEQMRLNAAAVLLELPGLEKGGTDETPVGHTEMTNKVHVGHNGMTNVPFIGGVVTSSSSMEDYSYRSGDVSFAQAQTKTKKKEPPAPQEVIYDEHGNEIKIARNLSAGRKPRKLRLRRMMEAAQEEARVIARDQAAKAANASTQQLTMNSDNNYSSNENTLGGGASVPVDTSASLPTSCHLVDVMGQMSQGMGNMSEGMNPYSYMQPTTVPGLMPLPSHADGASNYYMNASQGLPIHDMYGTLQQQNPAGYPDMYGAMPYMYMQQQPENMDSRNVSWMGMAPLNVSMNGNDDHSNNGITIDGSTITIINNTEEGKVN